MYSCSNEEIKNSQQEEFNKNHSAKATFDRVALANIDGSTAIPLYNEIDLKAALVSEGFYDIVESVDVDYGFNEAENENEAYFTVVGSKDDKSVAYQVELVIEGGEIFITNPEITPYFFNKHTCAGSGCSSCAFVKANWLKITGCTCNEPAIEGGYCNHTKSQDLVGGAIQFVSLVIGVL